MFNSLTGEITYKGDERLCVQTAGVGWELTVSRRALERLPAIGQVARIYTHLVHRDDAIDRKSVV
jgi:holliday junction DNA helicase RuvA